MAASSQRQMNRRGSRSRGNNRGSIYRELHGQKFLPTEMPPSFVAQPWNNVNLILRLNSTTQVTVADVRTALQAQAGFTNVPITGIDKSNVHFDIRLKSYSVWAIDSRPMAIMPMDLLNSSAELCRIDSNPQKNMYARAGYKLPLAQSSVTISTFRQKGLVLLNFLGATEFEVHINVLWKGVDTSLPTLSYTYPIGDKHRMRTKLIHMLENLEISDDEDPVLLEDICTKK